MRKSPRSHRNWVFYLDKQTLEGFAFWLKRQIAFAMTGGCQFRLGCFQLLANKRIWEIFP